MVLIVDLRTTFKCDWCSGGRNQLSNDISRKKYILHAFESYLDEKSS